MSCRMRVDSREEEGKPSTRQRSASPVQDSPANGVPESRHKRSRCVLPHFRYPVPVSLR